MADSAGLPALDESAQIYLRFHSRRYEFLLQVIARTLAPVSTPPRILDIGLSWQTVLLQKAYPDSPVDTLGYFDHRFTAVLRGTHTNYDLNNTGAPASWPLLGPYDCVIFAEVIEHLHTAPTHVLACIASWLRPGGSIVIQTPNPVSLGKRWAMLWGCSPFEIIRDDPANPGHFCEYTVPDLRYLAKVAGLELTGVWLRNYFGPGGWPNHLYSAACTLFPGKLHDGITVTLRKPHL